MRRLLHRANQWWLTYEYKHTTLALLALVLFVFVIDGTIFVPIVRVLDEVGIVSGVIAGALSVSFFTAVPALVLLLELAKHHDPVVLALLVAAGGVLGDWLIIKFFEERIFAELEPLAKKLKIHQAIRKLRRPATQWIVALMGALIISSPLPDEAGLALMGLTKYNRTVILTVCFILNALGAYVFISAAQVLL